MVFSGGVLGDGFNRVSRIRLCFLREPLHETGEALPALSAEYGVSKRGITELNVEHPDVLDNEGFAVFQINGIADRIREVRCRFCSLRFLRFIPFGMKHTLCRLVPLRFVEYYAVNPFSGFFPGIKRIDGAVAVENEITAVTFQLIVGKSGGIKRFYDFFDFFGRKLVLSESGFLHCGDLFLVGLSLKLFCLNVPADFQERDIVIVQKVFSVIADGRSDYDPLIPARLRCVVKPGLYTEIDRRVEKQRVVSLTEEDSAVFFRESAFVHELEQTPLHLRPAHCYLVAVRPGEMQRFGFIPSVFVRKPCSCAAFPAMLPHILDHSFPAVGIAVPPKKGFIDVFLRQFSHRFCRFISGIIVRNRCFYRWCLRICPVKGFIRFMLCGS